jgi:hypothetical protein
VGIVALGAGESRNLGFVPLRAQHGSVTATIILAERTSHGGSVVSLASSESGFGVTATAHVGVTGDDGAVTVAGLAVGSYVATVTHDGYATRVADVTIASKADAALTMTLVRSSGDYAIDGGARYARTPSVTLELYGFAHTFVQASERPDFADAAWVAFDPAKGSLPFTLSSGDGLKTVNVRFADDPAAPGSPVAATIVLDTTPPTVRALRLDDGTAYTNDPAGVITAFLDVVDGGSGVADMRYDACDGAGPCAFGGDAAWEPYQLLRTVGLSNASIDGAKTVIAMVRDAAGNVTTVTSRSVVLDRVAPQPTLAIAGAPTRLATRLVHLSLGGVSPSEAPLLAMRVSNLPGFPDGSFVPLASTLEWVLLPGDGVKAVFAEVIDRAGNSSGALEVDVTLDTTGPAAPQLFFASADDVSAHLRWTRPADGDLAGYVVERRAASEGAFSRLAPMAPDLLSPATLDHIDTGLTPGSAYRYRVSAFDDLGNSSGPSIELSFVPITPPTATYQFGPSVRRLGWTVPQGTTLLLPSYRREAVNGVASVDALPTNSTSLLITDASQRFNEELLFHSSNSDGSIAWDTAVAFGDRRRELAAGFVKQRSPLTVDSQGVGHLVFSDTRTGLGPYYAQLSHMTLTAACRDDATKCVRTLLASDAETAGNYAAAIDANDVVHIVYAAVSPVTPGSNLGGDLRYLKLDAAGLAQPMQSALVVQAALGSPLTEAYSRPSVVVSPGASPTVHVTYLASTYEARDLVPWPRSLSLHYDQLQAGAWTRMTIPYAPSQDLIIAPSLALSPWGTPVATYMRVPFISPGAPRSPMALDTWGTPRIVFQVLDGVSPPVDIEVLGLTYGAAQPSIFPTLPSAAAFDGIGGAVVAYYAGSSNQNMELHAAYLPAACFTGGACTPAPTTVDTSVGFMPSGNSPMTYGRSEVAVGIDGTGTAHLVYTAMDPYLPYQTASGTTATLRYLTFPAASIGTCNSCDLDSSSDVGENPTLALDPTGLPRIAYASWTQNRLRYIEIDRHRPVRLDSRVALNHPGYAAAIAVDAGGQVFVSWVNRSNYVSIGGKGYQDHEVELMRLGGARVSLDRWNTDAGTGTTDFVSLAVGPAGVPRIAYYNHPGTGGGTVYTAALDSTCLASVPALPAPLPPCFVSVATDATPGGLGYGRGLSMVIDVARDATHFGFFGPTDAGTALTPVVYQPLGGSPTTVDTSGSVSTSNFPTTSVALDAGGLARLAYDWGDANGRSVRWVSLECLTAPGGCGNTALTLDATASIATEAYVKLLAATDGSFDLDYYDRSSGQGRLMNVNAICLASPGGCAYRVVDPTTSSGGQNDMGRGPDGVLQLAYVDRTDKGVAYTRLDGAYLPHKLVTSPTDSRVALAVDSHSTPHIAYRDASDESFWYLRGPFVATPVVIRRTCAGTLCQ